MSGEALPALSPIATQCHSAGARPVRRICAGHMVQKHIEATKPPLHKPKLSFRHN